MSRNTPSDIWRCRRLYVNSEILAELKKLNKLVSELVCLQRLHGHRAAVGSTPGTDLDGKDHLPDAGVSETPTDPLSCGAFVRGREVHPRDEDSAWDAIYRASASTRASDPVDFWRVDLDHAARAVSQGSARLDRERPGGS